MTVKCLVATIPIVALFAQLSWILTNPEAGRGKFLDVGGLSLWSVSPEF